MKTLYFLVFLLFASPFAQTPQLSSFIKIDFADSTTGFILTLDGQILRTDDAGKSWSLLPKDFDELYCELEFPSPDTGYVAKTYSDEIYRTIDGGMNWELIEEFKVRQMKFVNGKMGFLATYDYADILKTTTAGMTWYPTLERFTPNSMSIENFPIIYSASWCCNLAKSTDGGSSWTRISTFLPMVLLSVWEVDFISENVGFVFGSGLDPFTMNDNFRIIGRTTNSGQSWDTHYLPEGISLSDLHFKDKDSGWILSDGNIYYTDNFFMNKVATNLSLRKFIFFDDTLSIGITAKEVYKTYDGWKTYEKLYPIETGVNDESAISSEYLLSQNYPNPFNPSTTIKFSTPPSPYQGEGSSLSAGKVEVRLIVYDILGREIKTLLNKPMQPGSYEVEFDGSDLTSGVYFYVLEAGDRRLSKKMLLMK